MAKKSKSRPKTKKVSNQAKLLPPTPTATLGGNSSSGSRRRRRRGNGATNSQGYTQSMPLSVGTTYITRQTPFVTISGSDWLEADSISQQTVDGTILTEIEVHPSKLGEGDTHLASLSKNFERYRFKRLSFQVVSRSPTTTGGGYLAGFTPDPKQLLAAGPRAKRAVRAFAGSVSCPLWQSSKVGCKLDNVLRYTEGANNDPFFSTGKFFVVLDGQPSLAAPTDRISLSIEVTWTIEFQAPTVPEPEVPPTYEFIIPPTNTSKGSQKGTDGPTVVIPYGPLDTLFWEKSKFDDVYEVSPSNYFKDISMGTAVGPPFWRVVDDVDIGRVIVPYTTEALARAVASNTMPTATQQGFTKAAEIPEYPALLSLTLPKCVITDLDMLPSA